MNQIATAHTLSRLEREKLNRKQSILQAARELFIQNGYHDTKLEDIAQRAEFGKGTIYNYFRNKEELFYGIIDQSMNEILQLAQSSIQATAGGAREKLTAYAKVFIEYAHENSDLFHLVMREIRSLTSDESQVKIQQIMKYVRNVWEIIAQPIDKEIQEGKLKSHDAIKLAALFDSMLRLFCLNMHGSFQFFKDDTNDEIANFVVSVFFDGVAE